MSDNSNFRILHISTKDTGGAAMAAIRLHKGLLHQNVNSKFLFKEKKSTTSVPESLYLEEKHKTWRQKAINKLGLRASVQSKNNRKLKNVPGTYEMFSFPDSDVDITQLAAYEKTDIINLHWVPRFLDYTSFFRQCQKPIVWTLHDMNPFLGGFHYLSDHQKNEALLDQIDREIELTKWRAYQQCRNLTVVTPSLWMYRAATQSEMLKNFPAYHIPNGIDTTIFKVFNQAFARQVFNLPQDKKILLFVSDSLGNWRKGFDLLLNAIVAVRDESLWLCTVGRADIEIEKLHNVTNLGTISDERLMAILYSACDAFVLPSREDNFPNVLLEATACGTPVIAFPVGGVVDIIQHGKNGLIAKEVSEVSLKLSIESFLSANYEFDRARISENTTASYGVRAQALNYIEIYKGILNEFVD